MPADKTIEAPQPAEQAAPAQNRRRRPLWSFAELGRRAGLGQTSTIYGSD